MTGMLIGVAALSAWGFYRFNQILAANCRPDPAQRHPDGSNGRADGH